MYSLRSIADLQIFTIYRDLKSTLNGVTGTILDVGCGQSPYRHLLGDACTYQGIDVNAAKQFDYENPDVMQFDGKHIPFADDTFDVVMCTEVLEHVYHYEELIADMHRVLKPNGTIIVTVPWSARFHYIPHDFFRYTPSALAMMFERFSSLTISQRGNEICVIANKTLVLLFTTLRAVTFRTMPQVLLCLCFLPLASVMLVLAHLTLALRMEDSVDPLGYTVRGTKSA